MRPLLPHHPLTNQHNPITHPHHRHLMRHHQRRTPKLRPLHRIQHSCLIHRVQRTRTFVQNQHLCWPSERTRNLQPLSLPAGYERRILSRHRVVSLWQRHHKLVYIRGLRSFPDIDLRRALIAVPNVLSDGSVEEVRVLADDGNVVA